MSLRASWLATLGACSLALAVAACGGSGDTDNTGPGGGSADGGDAGGAGGSSGTGGDGDGGTGDAQTGGGGSGGGGNAGGGGTDAGGSGGDAGTPPCTDNADCDDGDACNGAETCSSGNCVDGTAPDCDDNNACTADDCDAASGCTHTNLSGTACDDGDWCTTGETCGGGSCGSGTAVVCDDNNVCTSNACDPATGCVYTNTTDACDDLDPCTTGDTCGNGACAGGAAPACDDGNPCTADSCDSAVTGGCVNTDLADGTVCPGDANLCTNDFCVAGQCNTPVDPGTVQCSSPSCSGAPPSATAIPAGLCDGSGSCSIPAAISCGSEPCNTLGTACQGGCGSDTDCPAGYFCSAAGSCDQLLPPGDPCTRPGMCDTSICVDSVCCTSGCGGGNANDCQACNSSGACAPLNGTSCNDSNACTAGDSCTSGSCGGTGPTNCDDGNPCTVDTCSPTTGCVHTAAPNGTTCSDSNACTTVDQCQAGTCVGASPVVCQPLDQCHVAGVCDQTTGVCTNPNRADGSSCNDSNACTQTDTCQAGACMGGNSVTCAVPDQCHDPGTCNPATGTCSNPAKANGTSCSDSNGCTQTDTCQAGTCTGSNPVVCPVPDQCHNAGSCNPATGACTNPAKPNGTTCNDSSACTQTDTCQAGVCTGGNSVVCPQPDQCHDPGTCNPTTGSCTNPAKTNGTGCDDNNECTNVDQCIGGTCTGSDPPVCDNGIFCDGTETCNPATGCVPGTAVICPQDSFSCTAQFCDPVGDACVTVQQDAVCDDGLHCNGIEQCEQTAPGHDARGCVAGTPPPCDDGVACTTNGCDEATDSCTFPPNHGACLDSNLCDGTEVCTPSGCAEGTALTCDDGVSCTTNSCNPATGCVYTGSTAPGNPCDNGLFCDGLETCTLSGCADGTNPDCADNDGIACTVGFCDTDPAVDQCDVLLDSSLCGGGDVCTPTGCGQDCTTAADCDDGLACTGTETCDTSQGLPGRCIAGTPPPCGPDPYPCTTATCQEPTGNCVQVENDAACIDQNPCDGVENCVAGVGCVEGAPLVCDDNIPCTLNLCLPTAGGCTYVPSDTFCIAADGQACNGDEVCSPGAPSADADGCIAGVFQGCPNTDGIDCTREDCVEPGGCVSIADDTRCAGCGETCEPSEGGCGNFCVVSTCQGQIYACGDCLDNDGDCKIDTLGDEHCLGPCSNNETGFKGEISGQDHGNCTADCYFDKDDGAGNDTCEWSHDCDPLSLATSTPPYTPHNDSKCNYANNSTQQNAQCDAWNNQQTLTCWDPTGTPPTTNYCGSLVPNGCDCFGCCEIPGAPTTVFLGSRPDANDPGTCNMSTLDDPNLCYPCTQVDSCLNTCETCEICVGKPELPPECTCQVCAPGEQLCGAPCGTPCPTGFFCRTGCCAPNPGG